MAIKLSELGYVARFYDYASAGVKRFTETMEAMEGATKVGLGFGLEQLGEGIKSFGEKTTGALEGMVDAAADTETQLANLQKVANWKSDQIDAVREAAERFSSVHLGSTDEFLAMMEKAAPIFRDQKLATDAATQALELHTATGIADAEALNLIVQANATFNNTAEQTVGQLAAIKKTFGLLSLDGISSAFGRLSGAALAAGGNSIETLGVMAKMQQVLGPEGAGRAAMALAEVLTHSSKYGIDASHGLVNALDQVRMRLTTMGHSEQIEYLSKIFGETAGVRMLPLIGGTAALRDNLAKVAALAPTALGGMDRIAEASHQSAVQILNQNIQNLNETLGKNLLPTLNNLDTHLSAATGWLTNFANQHQTATAGVIGFLGALGWITKVLGTVIVWLGAAALLAGLFGTGFGEVAGAIAVLAVGISGTVAILYAYGDKITDFFTNLAAKAPHWALSLVEGFAQGLLDATGLGWLGHALGVVGSLISDHFPHSPAKRGPLRDLNRIRIVETIAASMRPAPLVAAMSRIGMAAMVAAPLMFGAGAGTASASGGPAMINFAPRIELSGIVGDKEAIRRVVMEALRASSRELLQEVDRASGRRDRRSFSG